MAVVVPLIRILDGVSVDVPTVVVPVRVHRTFSRTQNHPRHHSPNHGKVVSNVGHRSPPALYTNSCCFLKKLPALMHEAYPMHLSHKSFLRP